MFDKLVESGSHSEDIARKGTFFLGTAIIYAFVLLGLFVAGIVLYDAHLENQNLELMTLVAPVPPPPAAAAPEPEAAPAQRQQSAEPQIAQRAVAQASVNVPQVAPPQISTQQAQHRDLPPTGAVITGRDVDVAPSGPVGPPTGGMVGGTGTGGGVVAAAPPPPPPPTPTPTPRPPSAPISGGVLNGRAISKPAPPYPAIARAARASGVVTVQILVDEQGRVVSARAVNGHPLLQQAAVQAAYQARFSPTLLSGQPVRVSGVITYNFVLQ